MNNVEQRRITSGRGLPPPKKNKIATDDMIAGDDIIASVDNIDGR